jgi:hypothetical protein
MFAPIIKIFGVSEAQKGRVWVNRVPVTCTHIIDPFRNENRAFMNCLSSRGTYRPETLFILGSERFHISGKTDGSSQ